MIFRLSCGIVNFVTEQLDLSHKQLNDDDCVMISRAIKLSHMLKDLSLHGNEIGPRGITLISNALATSKCLKRLTLYDNNWDDKCIGELKRALRENTKLEELFMFDSEECSLEMLRDSEEEDDENDEDKTKSDGEQDEVVDDLDEAELFFVDTEGQSKRNRGSNTGKNTRKNTSKRSRSSEPDSIYIPEKKARILTPDMGATLQYLKEIAESDDDHNIDKSEIFFIFHLLNVEEDDIEEYMILFFHAANDSQDRVKKLFDRMFKNKLSIAEAMDILKNDIYKEVMLAWMMEASDQTLVYFPVKNMRPVKNKAPPYASLFHSEPVFDTIPDIDPMTNRELFEFLKWKRVNALWYRLFDKTNEEDGSNIYNIIDEIGQEDLTKALSLGIKQLFVEEVTGVLELKRKFDDTLTQRIKKKLNSEPSLMQWLICYRVQNHKAVGNWCSTGSGKTIAALMAAKVIDSRLTLVICPKSVIETWKRSIKYTYKNSDTYILKSGTKMPEILLQPSFLIMNYEKCRRKDKMSQLEKILGKYLVNFVVIDEVHRTKGGLDSVTTQGFAKCLQNIKTKNPDFKVIAATATPLMNNLKECWNLLSVVTQSQRDIPDTSASPTLSQCMDLYYSLVTLPSLRYTSRYPIRYLKSTVAITATEQQFKHIVSLFHKKKLDMELELGYIRSDIIACLAKYYILKGKKVIVYSDRLSGVVRKIKRNNTQLTLKEKLERSFSEMGINKEQEDRLKLVLVQALVSNREASGDSSFDRDDIELEVSQLWSQLRQKKADVCLYTGGTKEVDQFTTGDAEVVIGSSAMSTGIDGFQMASNILLFNTIPWTHALFQQIVGRILRQGQPRSRVKVYLVFVNFGTNGPSYCQMKYNHMANKKLLSEVAIDGNIPDRGFRLARNISEDSLINAWLSRIDPKLLLDESCESSEANNVDSSDSEYYSE